MAVRVRYHTDPACSRSWAKEPWLRRLMVEFGDQVEITYVMAGLAREIADPRRLIVGWLNTAADSGMPIDPRIWAGDPPRSTYPACIACKAAAEQGPAAEERYLRRAREGFLCHRLKLDGPDALVREADRAGLDLQRFRIDLESHATLEAFGADLEEARARPEIDGLPALSFTGGGDERWVGGDHSYEDWRAAALAAGASPASEPSPDVPGALRRFDSMATTELAAVCDLPGPRAGAEVWRLAGEWRVRRIPVLFGELWEAAEPGHH